MRAKEIGVILDCNNGNVSWTNFYVYCGRSLTTETVNEEADVRQFANISEKLRMLVDAKERKMNNPHIRENARNPLHPGHPKDCRFFDFVTNIYLADCNKQKTKEGQLFIILLIRPKFGQQTINAI